MEDVDTKPADAAGSSASPSSGAAPPPPPPPDQEQMPPPPPPSSSSSSRITVRVRHLDSVEKIRLSEKDATVLEVKRIFKMKVGQELTQLAFGEREVHDDDHLVEHMGFQSDDSLVGKMQLTVEDPDCELSTNVEAFAFETVEDLMRRYADVAGRVLHGGSRLSTHERELQDGATISACSLYHGDKLTFESAAFSIMMETTPPGASVPVCEAVEVRDSTTVAELRSQFKSKTVIPFSDDAKVLRNTDVLEDGTMLFRYKLRHNAKLVLESEDSAQIHHYICADCGSEVKLKKSDVVRCRVCGHRIVFKKRTTRPGQYMAR